MTQDSLDSSKSGKTSKSTIQVRADVASKFRRIAGFEEKRPSEMLEAMVQLWLEHRQPNLDLK